MPLGNRLIWGDKHAQRGNRRMLLPSWSVNILYNCIYSDQLETCNMGVQSPVWLPSVMYCVYSDQLETCNMGGQSPVWLPSVMYCVYSDQLETCNMGGQSPVWLPSVMYCVYSDQLETCNMGVQSPVWLPPLCIVYIQINWRPVIWGFSLQFDSPQLCIAVIRSTVMEACNNEASVSSFSWLFSSMYCVYSDQVEACNMGVRSPVSHGPPCPTMETWTWGRKVALQSDYDIHKLLHGWCCYSFRQPDVTYSPLCHGGELIFVDFWIMFG